VTERIVRLGRLAQRMLDLAKRGDENCLDDPPPEWPDIMREGAIELSALSALLAAHDAATGATELKTDERERAPLLRASAGAPAVSNEGERRVVEACARHLRSVGMSGAAECLERFAVDTTAPAAAHERLARWLVAKPGRWWREYPPDETDPSWCIELGCLGRSVTIESDSTSYSDAIHKAVDAVILTPIDALPAPADGEERS